VGPPETDAARIEVLTAQLEAVTKKGEDTDKRCSYLLTERVRPLSAPLILRWHLVMRHDATGPQS